MGVLCLQGSPRRKGSTATMLGWTEDALAAAGHEVEHVHIADKHISGCIDCRRCQRDPDELICSVRDDGAALLNSVAQADAVIYATPLYCWGFAAQLKPLIDRHMSLVTGFLDPATHRSHVEGTTVALLVTCGGQDAEGNTDCIKLMWQRLAAFGKFSPVYELIVPGCLDASSLGDEHKSMAEELASKVAG